MNDADKERVAAALRDIESRHGCRVLFAVESGSRAWGFASPDSDYDVRGVFVKPLDWYLQLKSDVPDTIVEELPCDIDVSLWDLRKALLQMTKSNASFLEWLGSPIVYRDDGLIAALNELKDGCFNPAHVAYHYASMFRKAMEARNEDGTIRIKKLCYALRANLCLKYAMAVEEMPPTPFADVLESVSLASDELDAIREVLARKETALESDVIFPDARLVGLLVDRYDSIAVHPWRKGGIAGDVYARLEHLFVDTVKGGELCG
ncbi:MAG: nucleotidyltransferase domain-containing protein [Kiritimatiellae bacterium]|nr:nucleotidyltransferase domain-containing protein [Kiritimatiellia bacterium]